MEHREHDERYQYALRVQQLYQDRLMQLPHVIGVGVGYAHEDGRETDEIALIVMVDEKVDEDELDEDEIIPSRIMGVRVEVQEMGGSFSAF
ncbi:hypothetical protein FBR02_12990 [Anaerolineae bacterium CFX9]|jgi:hypothetical protein|nr:hypothetical protein [Anaerolineae bacterium CFX9]